MGEVRSAGRSVCISPVGGDLHAAPQIGGPEVRTAGESQAHVDHCPAPIAISRGLEVREVPPRKV